jgi:thiosulfate dehydrogenase (quinone) large subunit
MASTKKSSKKEQYIWVLLRLGMGWIFIWAFIDKLFGLGFATATDNAWLAGGSPTFGFLTHATKGPFAGFYQSLAGNLFVDWLFMMALLGIGLALILGIGLKIAGYSGSLLMLLLYSAGFLPPKNNPFFDEHIIYAVVLVGLTFVKSGHLLGLGNWWCKTRLVKKHPVLE